MSYCPSCGQKVEGAVNFCTNCGQALTENAAIQPPPAPAEEPRAQVVAEEEEEEDPTYYSDKQGVYVTATRLIVPSLNAKESSITYSIANITSVKVEKANSPVSEAFSFGFLGILGIIAGIYWHIIWLTIGGAVFIVLGIILGITLKSKYNLKIKTGAGNDRVLLYRPKDYIEKVATAINKALITRG